jgi:serine phosphatase RsbU (regulator of sigma subunit)
VPIRVNNRERGVFFHESGDLVVLFTDGVSESMNVRYEEWGEERLIELAKTCHGLPALHAMRRILAAAQVLAEGAPQHDDMTVPTENSGWPSKVSSTSQVTM